MIFVVVLALMLGFASVACVKQHLRWKRDEAAESERRAAWAESMEGR